MTEPPIISLDQVIDDVARRLGEALVPEGRRPGPRKEDVLTAPLIEPPTSNRELARFIDHTLLKPEVNAAAIEQHCLDALRLGFAAVCVNPQWVEHCARLLAGSGVRVASVAGFPLGATTARIKAFEAAEVVRLGASEVDMVLNLGKLKDREWGAVRAEMEGVVEAASGAVVKVIIETGLLGEEEKIAACLLARAAGVDFVKTSTGINSTGATIEDVRLMRRVVGSGIGVKAAGGIRDAATACAMLAAGATRLGTSASVAIVTGA